MGFGGSQIQPFGFAKSLSCVNLTSLSNIFQVDSYDDYS